MKLPSIVCLGIVWTFMVLPGAARAQTVLSGSIAGVVQDASGAVLPGVTVEAASPALIEKIRTAVTDGQGLYRIVDLRPGVYTVTFTLPGFATVRREGLELTTGFTATVNAELRVGALEETITVSGASPIVDISNVRQQNVLSREILDAVPSGKWVPAYAAMTPGATLSSAVAQDVGGNRGEAVSSMGIHGSRAGDMKMLLDGFGFNGSTSGAGGGRFFMLNVGSVQEMVLETGGIAAESETGGIQVNGVPKEGGNSFTGSFLTNYTGPDLQNSNLTDELRARGLTADTSVKKVYDRNVSLGGPIRRDRLWFFSSVRYWGAEQYVPGNYFNKTHDSWFYTPDLSRPAYLSDINRDAHLRLTWQASQRNKINVAGYVQNSCACFFGLTGNVAPDATSSHRYLPNNMWQATWSYPATNRLLFEAGANALLTRTTLSRQPGTSVDDVSVLELSTNYAYKSKSFGGVVNNLGMLSDRQATQRFAVSYVTGSHAFKTGFMVKEAWRRHDNEINQDTSYTFLNGVPRSITLWAKSVDETRMRPNLGIYAQDQWTIKRLTLNLGVRFDYFNAHVPAFHVPAGRWVPAGDFAAVSDVPNWTDLSPRLGAAYDLFGTGKTALKVSLGRYVVPESITFARNNSPVFARTINATRTWADANGDFIPQEEELGPISNVNFGKPVQTTRYADDVRTGFGIRPANWQGSASIQHELRPGLGLNVAYYRTWYTHFTATDNLAVTPADYDSFCITAPVDRRLPGGGGTQQCGLFDIRPSKFGQVDNLVTQASHYGKREELFNGVDVTLSARFGQGAMFSGGLSTGRQVNDTCFAVDVPPRDRFCRSSPPLSAGTQVKFSGAYPLPAGFQASATYQNLPGIPIAASYVATNAQIAPSLGRNLAAGTRGTVVVDLIEPNTLFEDRITQLDVRLTRIFRVGRTRIQGMFDVYNLLNASPILSMNTRYGAAWLQPQTILAGRLFKFGVQLDF